MIFKLALFFILVFMFSLLRNYEGFASYKRCPQKKVRGILKEVFDENEIEIEKNNQNQNQTNYDFYFPCGYNGVERELKELKLYDEKIKIYGIDGCDKIVSKNNLWNILVSEYGFDKASNIMPKSYSTNNSDQMKRFTEDYKENTTYICKKNLQRKKGLKLSNKYYDLINSKYDGFKVIQEFKNSYLINNRKFNVRIYVLIVAQNNTIKVYLHTLNKILYATKTFDKDKNDFESNITNSYDTEKNIYETHPHDIRDFEMLIDDHTVWNKIKHKMTLLSRAIVLPLNNAIHIKKHEKFQLFGIDVLVDENKEPFILEINKGPDMAPKDSVDKKLKKKVLNDVFNKLELGADVSNTNKFELIYSI